MKSEKNQIQEICFPAINGHHIAKHIRWDQLINERLDVYNTVRIDPDNLIWVEAFQTETE